MENFVTREEFQRLETTVDRIDNKVDDLHDSVIRLEEGLKGLPDRLLAELPSKLYDGCTRISWVENAIKKLEDNLRWVTRLVLGTVITALLALVLKANI